jgi:hypothetical protein
MMTVRQLFPKTVPVDIAQAVGRELGPACSAMTPGARIAVAVGSRGISNLQAIIRSTLDVLKQAGAKPFIVPAMGSHGGGTPEGQVELLADYGVSEQALGVPVKASVDTECLGTTEDGYEVHFSREALQADGVLVVNRVKPHTDFRGKLGSGILKMMVVGLGKRAGASRFHRAVGRLGGEHVLRTSARVILSHAPIFGGLALVEDQHHDTASIRFLVPADIETREEELMAEAHQKMARLPFERVDLLVVDSMGKNISGSGMDPNVIGRTVHGYSSAWKERMADSPAVGRLMVRALTPESHGNATGLGMADFTTARLVESMDRKVTTVNTMTSMSLECVKIPAYFDTDRETLEVALDTLVLAPDEPVRMMRVLDTLNLNVVQLSEAYAAEVAARDDLEMISDLVDVAFDGEGNLTALITD